MKALKLKIYQETTCYKKPFSVKVGETYPLPPYSTIFGLCQNILGVKSGTFEPLDISIQGTYESIVHLYNTKVFIKPKDVITSMPLYDHLLYGVSLIIHISGETSVLNKLYNNLKNNCSFYSLGRREDMFRLDSIEFVDLQKIEIDEDGPLIKLKNNTYIPYSYDCDANGIYYRLNKTYKVKNNLRTFEKVDVRYVEKGSKIEYGLCYIDSSKEQDICFLA